MLPYRRRYNVVWMPWRRLYLDCGLGTPTSPPNWCAPLNNWTTIYLANPLETFNATSGDPSRLLGAEVATWSEHIVPSILDYVVWPRAAALAERLWSPEKDTQVLLGWAGGAAWGGWGVGWGGVGVRSSW